MNPIENESNPRLAEDSAMTPIIPIKEGSATAATTINPEQCLDLLDLLRPLLEKQDREGLTSKFSVATSALVARSHSKLSDKAEACLRKKERLPASNQLTPVQAIQELSSPDSMKTNLTEEEFEYEFSLPERTESMESVLSHEWGNYLSLEEPLSSEELTVVFQDVCEEQMNEYLDVLFAEGDSTVETPLDDEWGRDSGCGENRSLLQEELSVTIETSFEEYLDVLFDSDHTQDDFLQQAAQEQRVCATSCHQEATNKATNLRLSTRLLPTPKSTKKDTQPRRQYVPNPTNDDVLFGRGGKSNYHPGNIRFRDLAEKNKDRYNESGSKKEKVKISRELVQCVHNMSGRFLVEDTAVGMYYIADPQVARRKASQCLREGKRRNPIVSTFDNFSRR